MTTPAEYLAEVLALRQDPVKAQAIMDVGADFWEAAALTRALKDHQDAGASGVPTALLELEMLAIMEANGIPRVLCPEVVESSGEASMP